MSLLRRLLAVNAATEKWRLPKIVKNYDPDWDGDDDAGGFDPDEDGDEATVFFYSVIGGWDAPETEDIVRAIRGLNVTTIHMRINSPGGSVFESTAIKTALEQHPARVIAHIDGVAASAASTLMLAADEIEIASGGFVMIHNPESFAWGDADEMRQAAEMLDKVRDSIVAQYADRTGMEAAALSALMAAETWFTAQEAIDNKFCDRLAAKSPAPANLKRFDLSAYAHAPDALRAPAARQKAQDEELAALRAQQARNERRLRLLAL